MLTAYIQAAMRHAHYEMIGEAEPFYGSIPLCSGVWANGNTLEDCREELQSVLEDWIVLGLRLGHDAAADRRLPPAAAGDDGANQQVGVERAVEADVAQRPAIHPPCRRLELLALNGVAQRSRSTIMKFRKSWRPSYCDKKRSL